MVGSENWCIPSVTPTNLMHIIVQPNSQGRKKLRAGTEEFSSNSYKRTKLRRQPQSLYLISKLLPTSLCVCVCVCTHAQSHTVIQSCPIARSMGFSRQE